MSLREIVRWPDTRLSTRCVEVPEITPDIVALASDMLETMYAAPGRGLAAPQVGVLLRVFVVDTQWKDAEPDPLVFINPEILTRSCAVTLRCEACLSIPGVETEIERPENVVMRWTDLDGLHQEKAFSGIAATCVQHELDHLDGIVTLDRLDAAARARALAAYQEGCE